MFTSARCWLTRRGLRRQLFTRGPQSSPSLVTMLLSRCVRAARPLIAAARPAARSLSAAAASSKRLDLSGIYPPIATPFTAAEDVDHGKLRENVHKYAEIPFRGQRSRRNFAFSESWELEFNFRLGGKRWRWVGGWLWTETFCDRRTELSGLGFVAIVWPFTFTTRLYLPFFKKKKKLSSTYMSLLNFKAKPCYKNLI